MPPKPDTDLEDRILKAAQHLWATRGEEGLTLRAVAKRARTTTPTVYKRFRDKTALRIALAKEFKAELNSYCLAAPTLEEVYRRYVRFAEENPHKYELLWRTWTEVFHPGSPRPLRSWFLSQMAGRFGGSPEDYATSFYGVFLVAHGAASLLTISGDAAAHEEIRSYFPVIADTVFANIHVLAPGSHRDNQNPREASSGESSPSRSSGFPGSEL